MATTETDWVEKVGGPAYASIAEMVAALGCDYDRLEELREEREALAEAFDDARNALDDWDEENAEELKELEEAAGDCEDQDQARQRIEEDALSVEVRSGWVTPGEGMTPEEFAILLSTGGPAVRIRGELDNGEPRRAWLEVQDWGNPWTQYCPAGQDTLLTYAGCFCFES